MTSIKHRFADLTAAIEDAHSIAVEGQHPDLSPDMQIVLATSLRDAFSRLAAMVAALAGAIR